MDPEAGQPTIVSTPITPPLPATPVTTPMPALPTIFLNQERGGNGLRSSDLDAAIKSAEQSFEAHQNGNLDESHLSAAEGDLRG